MSKSDRKRYATLRDLRLIDEPRWRIQNEPPVQCGGLCELPESLAGNFDLEVRP